MSVVRLVIGEFGGALAYYNLINRHCVDMLPRLVLRALLLAVLLLSSFGGHAGAASPRVGFLAPGTPESSAPVLAGLRQGLRENGYVEGTDITIDARYAYGKFDRLPDLARELIKLPVDVLVTYVTDASIAASKNSKTIPIVMVGVSDPVASGLVVSLSRPGGNITGTSGVFAEGAGRRLQFLKETIPGTMRVAVLWNPENRVFQSQVLRETEAAARTLGLQLRLFEAHDAASIETAFVAIAKYEIAALNVLPDPIFAVHHARIAELALKARLPSVSANSAFAEAGGLMAYGPSIPQLGRDAAKYVAKILRGANAADLPIEQPTKFELVINMKTAKQIGITVPQSLMVSADRLLE